MMKIIGEKLRLLIPTSQKTYIEMKSSNMIYDSLECPSPDVRLS
jgi:hypothetical protein